jgi:transcriptional/translational regulatory protein YebC/TACO1
MYDRKGKVEVPAVLDEEVLLDLAIEAGVDDFVIERVRTVS